MALSEIYIKLVVGFPNDPKVRSLARFGAPDAGLARDLYVQMCLHCREHLTDGFVPAEQVGLLVYPLGAEHGSQLAKQLASVGLIKEESKDGAQGWQVCAFLHRNASRTQVADLSEKRAEAGRTGGKKSRKPPGQRRSGASSRQVANQGVSKDPPIDRDRDIHASKEACSSDVNVGSPNVGDVVAAFVDGARATGQDDPASSLRARVGKQARQLLAEGKDIHRLIAAARTMGAGEWNDLAVQLRKDDAAANGTAGTPDRKQQATDDLFEDALDRARNRDRNALEA